METNSSLHLPFPSLPQALKRQFQQQGALLEAVPAFSPVPQVNCKKQGKEKEV